MRNFGFVGVAALLTLALAGCGHNNSAGEEQTVTTQGSGAPAGGGKTLQIAVIPKGTSHDYWKSIHAGANKAQQDLAKQGTQINVIWKGTESEGDRNGQVNIVETFVTQHVAGIVLAPLDSQALVTPVQDAAAHKIPVVIIDSALGGGDYVSFCATDNEKGGELAGERLAQLLGGKGRVILLPYQQGSASTEGREKGFLTVMKKYPGITVLSQNQYGGPTSDTAQTAAQTLLTRFGSQVDGVFASNESNTRGMRLALQDKGLLKKVKFVGFDASPDLVQALKDGELQGLVVQNPFKMGYIGVTTLVDAIQGKKVPKAVDTGVALITPDTISDPKYQDYLNPPINQYLR
ncbi:MAG: substrate-binding domain-containing protein [Armatimonadetes bacterium]|nr:substrate-binding domain-containing protein [Armatimonadota bacterium]